MVEKIIERLVEVFSEEWPDQIPMGGLNKKTPIFYDGIGIDSVDAVVLILAIEEKFKIQLDQEKLSPELFESVGTLAEFLYKELDSKHV